MYASKFSYIITHEEMYYTSLLLQYYMDKIIDPVLLKTVKDDLLCPHILGYKVLCISEESARINKLTMLLTQNSILENTASYDQMIKIYSKMFQVESYNIIYHRRNVWKEQKKTLELLLQKKALKVHFVTYATKKTEGLQNLLTSAKISNIDLKVSIHNFID